MLDGDLGSLDRGGRLGSWIGGLGRGTVGMQGMFGVMSMQATVKNVTWHAWHLNSLGRAESTTEMAWTASAGCESPARSMAWVVETSDS